MNKRTLSENNNNAFLRSSTLESNFRVVGMLSPKNTITDFGSRTELGLKNEIYSKGDFKNDTKNDYNLKTMHSKADLGTRHEKFDFNSSKHEKKEYASNGKSGLIKNERNEQIANIQGLRTDLNCNAMRDSDKMNLNNNAFKSQKNLNSNSGTASHNFYSNSGIGFSSNNAIGQNSVANILKTKKLTNMQKEEIWVKKWVDYSNKYGVGYLLSNGCNGVFFNDSTKILMDPEGL